MSGFLLRLTTGCVDLIREWRTTTIALIHSTATRVASTVTRKDVDMDLKSSLKLGVCDSDVLE